MRQDGAIVRKRVVQDSSRVMRRQRAETLGLVTLGHWVLRAIRATYYLRTIYCDQPHHSQARPGMEKHITYACIACPVLTPGTSFIRTKMPPCPELRLVKHSPGHSTPSPGSSRRSSSISPVGKIKEPVSGVQGVRAMAKHTSPSLPNGLGIDCFGARKTAMNDSIG